jgi:hypothetical protein
MNALKAAVNKQRIMVNEQLNYGHHRNSKG